jgi:hypothetical protein
MNVRPHVAQNTNGRRSAIDGRTTRYVGYAISQRIRKRIEEAFGWIKSGRRPAQDPVSRRQTRRMVIRLRRDRLSISCGRQSSWRRQHQRAPRPAGGSSGRSLNRPSRPATITTGQRRCATHRHPGNPHGISKRTPTLFQQPARQIHKLPQMLVW